MPPSVAALEAESIGGARADATPLLFPRAPQGGDLLPAPPTSLPYGKNTGKTRFQAEKEPPIVVGPSVTRLDTIVLKLTSTARLMDRIDDPCRSMLRI